MHYCKNSSCMLPSMMLYLSPQTSGVSAVDNLWKNDSNFSTIFMMNCFLVGADEDCRLNFAIVSLVNISVDNLCTMCISF